tara:strand:- start:330 stop:710 length:381 start_codon:yes stop_codon:yes gene_type:complete
MAYTKKKYQKKRKTIRKKRTYKSNGGKKRVEEIVVIFGRNNTNSDISSFIEINRGPNSFKAKSQPEYLVNFISDVVKTFEEELSVMIKGEAKAKPKKQIFKLVYKDSDVDLEKGADVPIKCKKKTK